MNDMNSNDFHFFNPSPVYRGFLILLEIDKEASISQKRLSHKVGLATSMVNNYLKDFEQEGLVEYRGKTRRQTKYFLTETGKAKKEELLRRYLVETVSLYKRGKREFEEKIQRLVDGGIKRVILFGASDTGEIIFNAARNLGMLIIGVVDNDTGKQGQEFCGRTILKVNQVKYMDPDAVIITSLGYADMMYKDVKRIEEMGVKIFRFV